MLIISISSVMPDTSRVVKLLDTSLLKTSTAWQDTVCIPEDRRLSIMIDLPDDVPTGNADVTVLISVCRPQNETKHLMDFAGKLSGSQTFYGDSLTLQRSLRDEW